MARNRTISPDFWTMEAVIDCKPMTRLLFIGLWNFADDGGVQPLRPRTIRMQVLPGDTIEDHRVRAMIVELAAQGLVRIYAVDSVEYVAIVDWDQLQRVGKRARRRYPAMACDEPSQTMADHRSVEPPQNPSSSPRTAPGENVSSVSEPDEGRPPASAQAPDHRKQVQRPSPGPIRSNCSVIPSVASDPCDPPGSRATLGMTGETSCMDVGSATPPAWPSVLGPPSTPADAPALHR